MTNSEIASLIREGTKLRPQGFGACWKWSDSEAIKSCVLGALLEGDGMKPNGNSTDIHRRIDEILIEFHLNRYACPAKCYNSPVPFGDLLIHLNDVEKWSREKIADWIETVEREETLCY